MLTHTDSAEFAMPFRYASHWPTSASYKGLVKAPSVGLVLSSSSYKQGTSLVESTLSSLMLELAAAAAGADGGTSVGCDDGCGDDDVGERVISM